MGISSKNYWFYVHRDIYTYAYIHAAHSFDSSSVKKKTQHITKGIILSLESAMPVSTYTRYHIYKSRLQRQELMRDNNCKKYRISNSISYVLRFRFTIFNMYIPHLTLYNHIVELPNSLSSIIASLNRALN